MKLGIGGSLLLAGLVMACADMPNAPSSIRGSEPWLVVSDPPPPPADGDEVLQTCEESPDPCPPPVIQVTPIAVRFFQSPASNVAFLTFSSQSAEITISPNARVRDNGNGIVGSGTITAKVRLEPNEPLVAIIVDLSTATGSLLSARPVRFISFQAEARFASTGEPVGIPVLFLYSFL